MNEPMKAKLTVSKKPHTELQAAFSALDREEVGCCNLLAENDPNLISNNEELRVEVFFLSDETPSICGIHGGINTMDLARLEEEVEQYDGYESGEGAYVFTAEYHPPQFAFGGMTHGDGYELTQVYFSSLGNLS